MPQEITIAEITIKYVPHSGVWHIFKHFSGESLNLSTQQLLDLKRAINSVT